MKSNKNKMLMLHLKVSLLIDLILMILINHLTK